MSSPSFPRLAVIGIGLIGSSFALALRAAGLVGTVVCGDADKMNVAKAIELEIVDSACRSNVEAVRDADLVVLAVPVGAMGTVMREVAGALKPGCIVMDVGSVKGAVGAAVEPFLPQGVAYVPAHPIAGTEESGPEAAFAELFQGKWCLLTPKPSTDAAAVARVSAAWTQIGARVACMGPEQHDRLLATVSHMPHMLAFSLMATADDVAQAEGVDVIGFAGSSFRDATRVAASDPTMWRDIFLTNRDAVLEIVERFKADLARLEEAVREGDEAAMTAFIARARALRRAQAAPTPVEPLPVVEEG
jgi:cyclohexadieny/prephenate dehydrogenase